jgi:hypothetical protein
MLGELGVPKADPLPQDGRATVPEAEVKPVQDRTLQPLVPGASLITPAGACTVTLQFGYPTTLSVSVPPGQYWSPARAPAGEPVTWNTNRLFAGQAALVVVETGAQMMSPAELNPFTNCPEGQVCPAATLDPAGPAGPVAPWIPCGPAGPVAPGGPWMPCGPVAPVGPWIPCGPVTFQWIGVIPPGQVAWFGVSTFNWPPGE